MLFSLKPYTLTNLFTSRWYACMVKWACYQTIYRRLFLKAISLLKRIYVYFWYLAPKTLLKMKGRITGSAFYFKLVTRIFWIVTVKDFDYWKKRVIGLEGQKFTLIVNKPPVFRIYWYLHDSFCLHPNIIDSYEFITCTGYVLSFKCWLEN